MEEGFRTQYPIPSHSLTAWPLCNNMSPPLVHVMSWYTINFFLQRSQAVGRFRGSISYRKYILSNN